MNEHDKNPYLPNGRGTRMNSRDPVTGPGLADFLPDIASSFRAEAGTALEHPSELATLDHIEDALRSVHDPEIPVNIFDLGLIYSVDRKQNGEVYILSLIHI